MSADTTATDGFRMLDRGAQVVEWQPDGAAHPVLFSSALAESSAERAWRGGVPVCTPWFGAGPDGRRSPSHGPARTAVWQRADAPRGRTSHRLVLDQDATGAPAQLELELATERTDDSLAITLEVRNTGQAEALVEAALHSYFAVSDVTGIELEGLDRAPFFDKITGLVRAPGAELGFGAPVDRIYEERDGTILVVDPGWSRTLRIEREGSAEAVVWNPGPDSGIGDLEPDAWRGFVCVEAACVGAGAVRLAPGGAHRLVSRMTVAED